MFELRVHVSVMEGSEMGQYRGLWSRGITEAIAWKLATLNTDIKKSWGITWPTNSRVEKIIHEVHVSWNSRRMKFNNATSLSCLYGSMVGMRGKRRKPSKEQWFNYDNNVNRTGNLFHNIQSCNSFWEQKLIVYQNPCWFCCGWTGLLPLLIYILLYLTYIFT